MSKSLCVCIRGLFAVVRHTRHNEGIATTEAEPMTVIFPAEFHGDHGSELPLSAHCAVMYVHEKALEESGLPPIPEGPPCPGMKPGDFGLEGYRSFPLRGSELLLPLTDPQTHDPVRHRPDEPVGKVEPTTRAPLDDFRPLSRLPNLNTLTRGDLLNPANLKFPAPMAVQARVVLSGGQLEGVKPSKPLGEAFFEFFDGNGPVAIQAVAEDVSYENSTDADGFVTLGFKDLARPAGQTSSIYRLKAIGDPPLILDSLPIFTGDPRKVVGLDMTLGLRHFSLYYALMSKGATPRRPKARFLARAVGSTFVHTMPSYDEVPCKPGEVARKPDPDRIRRGDRSLPEPCSCFAAQVFVD